LRREWTLFENAYLSLKRDCLLLLEDICAHPYRNDLICSVKVVDENGIREVDLTGATDLMQEE
jgi:hypothetical protein